MNEKPSPFSFPLIWTIGFSGKRHLPQGSEEPVAYAIEKALTYLEEKASLQNAKLTAISSIARGSDVLFATACQKPRDGSKHGIPWKCLLPFEVESFLTYDLTTAPDKEGLEHPLDPAERQQRRTMAEQAIAKAKPAEPDITNPKCFDPSDTEVRHTAYQECGYRTVDESDVIIAVLRKDEIARINTAVEARDALDKMRQEAWKEGKKLSPDVIDAFLARDQAQAKVGTVAIVLYAHAAKHPCILLDADAENPWDAKVILNDPEEKKTPEPWFHDPNVSPVMEDALALQARKRLPLDPDPCDSSDKQVRTQAGPGTAHRRDVWKLMDCLGRYAGANQKTTQKGLGRILLLHVIATGLAALLATAFGLTGDEFDHWKTKALWLVVGIAFFATCKPALAALAYIIEHRLHHAHQREKWLYARVLSELCRGMWAMWPLPTQPMDAADEEDFPKVKRLLRTLRIMRELDADAAIRNQPIKPGETQADADMRQASENYIQLRLYDQAHYYSDKMAASAGQLTNNMRLFHGALWGTMIIGSIVAIHKWEKVLGHHAAHHLSPWLDPWQWAEWLVIIGPFLASYALARITILDCRRRARRYDEMQWFLLRLSDTLRDCTATSSRLRIIEHAERMMIEEQHEWFSTTRNFSV